MGLTKVTNSPGLSIHLDNPRPVYCPGDVISGQVSLHTAAECAIGTVALSFWGRAKTKIIQQNGQSASVYRGRTRYFSVDHTLYTGQYTHKPGSFGWPFELTVPGQADPRCILSGHKWKPKDHFCTNVVDTPGDLDLTLPPTTFNSRHQARKVDCFVEYVLEASLTEPQDAHRFRGPKTKTSTLPVTFQPLPTPEPIRSFDLATDGPPRLVTISTLKLLPEHAGTNLGLRDRARSLFQRDSIPRFSFRLSVRAPTTIQSSHPAPLPFILGVEPDLDDPNTTTVVGASSSPVVTLRSFKVDLKTHVRCRAVATYADDKTYEVSLLNLKNLDQRLLPPDSTATKTFSNSISSSSTSPNTIDLGSLYDLRVGGATLGSRLESPLCPNFTSYNVSREYFLVWEIEVECAEKTQKFSSTKHGTPCEVLLPPATARMDGYDDDNTTSNNINLGVALESCRISTGENHANTSRGQVDGRKRSSEKEKPGFFTSGGDKTRHDHKTKAQEAAEEHDGYDHRDQQHQGPDSNTSVDHDNTRGAPEVYSRGQPPPQYVP
ncbi:hypothetical protein H2204_012980 [Knufia peltigerae]|uniref:Arrestin-like N-terminal domain-containing protein n=1 Tax=Knufia peltigerae TaxID=1002370 RepID=A0AA39CSG0_9EURO|nr:hypothetical protein H2204_012980 [Knufia peltigerae]